MNTFIDCDLDVKIHDSVNTYGVMEFWNNQPDT